MSPEAIARTEAIGEKFLHRTGMTHLRFTVGSRILSLLNADINSGYFTALESWIGMWTDGQGVEPFQRVLNR